MHSSTSSFERPVPQVAWGSTWLLVLVVVIGACIGFETFLRGRGYKPSVTDDEYAWAIERAALSDRSPHNVAILGSSRMQLAFSGDAFKAALPGWTYHQLAINGTVGVGALLDLARDPDFRGVVILDAAERAFVPTTWHEQDAYIAAYHRGHRAVGLLLERRLATAVQSRLVFLGTRGIATFGRWVRERSWPAPGYVTMNPDRTRYADFSLVRDRKKRWELARMEAWDAIRYDANTWLAGALAVEDAVAAIQARGGAVVYVRMPTCDERWRTDEEIAPKAQFWDVLATRSHALLIHFKDYPELSGFQCPDTSHLDSKDGPAFTRALIAIIQRHGLMR